jgi:AcrR family transcriptional regulator
VSSGIYRYFTSRDQLLTALIIDAYNDLGATVEAVDASCERSDFAGRWSSCCHAVRDWAIAHPHEYALIYGSPVPWYSAPEDTIIPASRVTLTLVAVIREATASGALRSPFAAESAPNFSPPAEAEASRLEAAALQGVPKDAIIRALEAWIQLFGAVNFEIFGRLVGVVEDVDALFDQTVKDMSAFVGIV